MIIIWVCYLSLGMLRFVWLLDAQRDNRCCSFFLRFAHQVPYWGIYFSRWGDLIGVVVHGRMVSIDYLIHVKPSVTLGIFLTLMRWVDLCLVFMIPYSTQGLLSPWSVIAFIASLSPDLSTFLSFFMICDIMIDYIWLCLGLRWITSDFTQRASMDSLVKSLWNDLFLP